MDEHLKYKNQEDSCDDYKFLINDNPSSYFISTNIDTKSERIKDS